MKTNSMILALVSLSILGGAGAAHAQDGGKPQRGAVTVAGQAARAVVVGPIAIHAYSEFSGAKLFVATAVTGTDRDCAAGATGSVVAADAVQTFIVGAGQVACVSTTNTRGTELLWHAQKDVAPSSPVLVASRR